MSVLQRLVAGVVTLCFVLSSTGVAFAQTTAPVPAAAQVPASDDTMAAGLLDGELLA